MTRIDDHGVLLMVPGIETVPEDSVHEQTVDLLLAGLRARYAMDDDIEICGRLAWFPDREDTRIRLDPDVMVVRGRPKQPRRSYRDWAEEHTVPALLIEVVSAKDTDDDYARRTPTTDYARRLGRARHYGVEEVVLIAPFAPGGVRVEHLRPDPEDPARFRTVAASTDPQTVIAVPVVDLRMSGGDRLRVIDEHDVWLEPGDAINRMRAESAVAKREFARAEEATARAERMAALLRAAGIDPDLGDLTG